MGHGKAKNTLQQLPYQVPYYRAAPNFPRVPLPYPFHFTARAPTAKLKPPSAPAPPRLATNSTAVGLDSPAAGRLAPRHPAVHLRRSLGHQIDGDGLGRAGAAMNRNRSSAAAGVDLGFSVAAEAQDRRIRSLLAALMLPRCRGGAWS